MRGHSGGKRTEMEQGAGLKRVEFEAGSDKDKTETMEQGKSEQNKKKRD